VSACVVQVDVSRPPGPRDRAFVERVAKEWPGPAEVHFLELGGRRRRLGTGVTVAVDPTPGPHAPGAPTPPTPR
jgi:hypothetical protein